MSEPPAARTPISQEIVAGALTAAIAGAAAGLIDGIWSWPALGQYLPGFLGRLQLLFYLMTTYGVVALVAGAIVAAVVIFYLRVTLVGALRRHATAEHDRARARDPRDALAGLALALAFVPIATIVLDVGYRSIYHALVTRKHTGLVIAIAMGGGVGLLAVALLLAIAVARPIELGLRMMAEGKLGRALSSPRAPLHAAAVLAVIGGGALIGDAWGTLHTLKLRPFFALLGACALAPGAAGLDFPAAARWQRLRRAPRIATAAALPIVLFAAAALAASDGVLKAGIAYSGGGDALTQLLQRAVDLDRDHYSPLFGGGDCDDFDASIHPGASDIPDDGIDQNCVAGDAHSSRSVADVGFVPVPPAVPPDFDVILITIDTLRADHVGAYGYARPTTPAIDQVAAEGARFTAGFAHAPSTRYSMPAILTGRMPLEVYYDTSVQGWPGIQPRATTLAEILKARGFITGAITNYWYFDQSRHMNQGFDSYDNSDAALHTGSDPAHTTGTSSRQQTDKALEFVAAHAAERFFLWVHYYDPHHEYMRHPEVQDFGSRPVDLYDDEIRFTDMHIGRLIDDLRRRGLWQKTVIVITGDHGEGFGEHGISFHGYDLYSAQTKVPLIIRVPGLAPRAITTAAGHVDILPTLANLAGAAPTTEMMGGSLVKWLAGAPDDPARMVFQEVSYEGNHEKRGAASAGCHVLYDISPHTTWEVYRLDRDPAETRDISATPGPCAGARKTFEKWFDSAQIPPGASDALLSGKPDVAHPLDIDFGGEVRLLAVDLPAQVHAGETFSITWTFAARGRLDAGWKVFVHIESPAGRFTADHAPARPFEWWKSGQYIRYSISASVPASAVPGHYDVWAGLWRKNARRPVHAPAGVRVVDNRVVVAGLEVVR